MLLTVAAMAQQKWKLTEFESCETPVKTPLWKKTIMDLALCAPKSPAKALKWTELLQPIHWQLQVLAIKSAMHLRQWRMGMNPWQ
jgi:hypothetical protein